MSYSIFPALRNSCAVLAKTLQTDTSLRETHEKLQLKPCSAINEWKELWANPFTRLIPQCTVKMALLYIFKAF